MATLKLVTDRSKSDCDNDAEETQKGAKIMATRCAWWARQRKIWLLRTKVVGKRGAASRVLPPGLAWDRLTAVYCAIGFAGLVWPQLSLQGPRLQSAAENPRGSLSRRQNFPPACLSGILSLRAVLPRVKCFFNCAVGSWTTLSQQ